jgi:hypothetical protein
MISLYKSAILLFLLSTTFCYGKIRTTKFAYDKVWDFQNGLARVQRQHKTGFINKKGEEVIECKYAWINYFNDVSGLASFTDSLNNFGYIDRKGKIIVEPRYKAVYDWDPRSGLVYVNRDGKYGFMNKEGIEVIPCIYDQTNGTPEFIFNGIVRMKKNGKYGILDVQGKTLVDFEYDYFIGQEWLEGFPEDYLAAKKGEEYFYINMKTFAIIKTPYAFAEEFHNGLATVMLDNKYGYIDSTFRLIIPCIFQNTRVFSEGLASVSDASKKWVVINKKGKLITPFIYDYIDGFSNGRAMVVKDSLVGFIDRSGKEVIPLIYDYETFNLFCYKRHKGFEDNISVVVKNGKYGMIDTLGNVVVALRFTLISYAEGYQLNLNDLYPITDNYAIAVSDSTCFALNRSGQVIDSYGSSKLIYFIEGLSSVCNDSNKCGFMNSSGELVLPYNYEYYEYSVFQDGLAVVKQNNKFGIIDKKGKIIIPSLYKELSGFSNDLAKASLEGKTYFLNQKGKIKLVIRQQQNS